MNALHIGALYILEDMGSSPYSACKGFPLVGRWYKYTANLVSVRAYNCSYDDAVS